MKNVLLIESYLDSSAKVKFLTKFLREDIISVLYVEGESYNIIEDKIIILNSLHTNQKNLRFDRLHFFHFFPSFSKIFHCVSVEIRTVAPDTNVSCVRISICLNKLIMHYLTYLAINFVIRFY